jgi:hypothetical protein
VHEVIERLVDVSGRFAFRMKLTHQTPKFEFSKINSMDVRCQLIDDEYMESHISIPFESNNGIETAFG